MDYHTFRAFADSWFLIAMVAFFVLAALWPFRSSARKANEEAREVPFRYDDKPAADKEGRA